MGWSPRLAVRILLPAAGAALSFLQRRTGGHDPFDAGSRPAGVRARLERAVQRRTLGAEAGRVDGDDFRVRTTGAQVGALPDHDAVL